MKNLNDYLCINFGINNNKLVHQHMLKLLKNYSNPVNIYILIIFIFLE